MTEDLCRMIISFFKISVKTGWKVTSPSLLSLPHHRQNNSFQEQYKNIVKYALQNNNLQTKKNNKVENTAIQLSKKKKNYFTLSLECYLNLFLY